MRKNYIIISAITILVGCVVVWGCKKEQKLGNAIYVTGTDVSNVTNLTVTQSNNPNATIAVSATASSLLASDATVTFAASPNLVAQFNQTSPVVVYTALPASAYTLSQNTAVIKAGANVSQSINVTITAATSALLNGPYLLPITITSVSGGGDVPILQASNTIYIIVTVLNSANRAIGLTNNFLAVNFTTNNSNLTAMTHVSYECRIKFNSFQAASPFISSVMGVEGVFLLRFGDVSIKPNQLEVATGGGNCIGTTLYNTGQWYHVAVTYDGTTVSLYVNGVLDNTFKYAGTVNISTAFNIGESAGGRYPDGSFDECRVWSRTLSVSDIQNNMCSMDPSSPNLEAYWRLNEGFGSVCTDLTGHGHTATASIAPTWITGLTCP